MTYYGLSKSRISAFEQCPRRLWLQVHRNDLIQVDADAEARFAAGHLVGEIACSLLPDGVMVEVEPDLKAAIITTQALLQSSDRPIFEGTFSHEGVLVRVDVMEPDEHGGWHIAEVKSSTKPKDYHVGDLATQIWVMEQCEVNIASASIRHLDSSFVLTHTGEYADLFKDSDLTEIIRPTISGRNGVVRAAREMLAGDEPECDMGAHCTSPFECEFQHWCSRNDPPAPEWPIAELPRTGARIAQIWGERGIYDIRDLPDYTGLSPTHQKIRQATISGTAFLDRAGVADATKDWAYPRIWIDFETITFPVPRWIGTRPWQQIPFQFSAHIEAEDGTIEHIEALDISGDDPQAYIAAALAQLPSTGAVIAWNASFERGCFRSLAQAIPAHAAALTSLEERTVDLLPVARAHYYHPNQRGSWSIKAVLPTIAPELDYGNLEVKDGGNAQLAFMEAMSADCTSTRRAAIDAALKAYCGRDTWAMIAVYRGMMGE